jgi:hypothetical protein
MNEHEIRDTIAELTELAAAFRFHLKLQPENEGIRRSLADVHADIVALRSDFDDLYVREMTA